MAPNIPILNNQFICIVDRDKPELAAVISSYLSVPGHYLPIFECPSVTSEKYEPEGDAVDENTLSRIRATEFSTFVNNILARINSCEFLIIAGLSANQKSYLDFLKKINVIEISKISEIDFHLSPFLQNSMEVLSCKSSQLLIGLSIAIRRQALLTIDDDAEELSLPEQQEGGIVVIEDDHCVTSVIAINYALSINAQIAVVDELEKDGNFLVQGNIEEWQKGDLSKLKELEKMVKSRVGTIEFDSFQFATFFTTGLPYSFILENQIPCSYVNLHLRPDFFIVNNLIYEKKYRFGGSVVFSPEFFQDEETKTVSTILSGRNYFVKELFGKNASVYNLDMHVKEFPYDIFHLCSHGGEIEGFTVEENFTDRDGKLHTIEYDSVLSFSPSSKKGLIAVQHKSYFKKFDGYKWRSIELKAQNHPHYVFADMQNATRISNAKDKKLIGPRKKIPNSCAISCSDSNHQAMFATLASHSSPFVFNNTCWSWSQIAESFLVSGARGYIGTLWNVQNKAAVDFATEFYRNVFSDTILNSFHSALKTIKGTNSENIYIFWGLHFSTFFIPLHKTESRENVFKQLMSSFYKWEEQLSLTKNKITSDLISELINWITIEMNISFNRNDLEILKKKYYDWKKNKS